MAQKKLSTTEKGKIRERLRKHLRRRRMTRAELYERQMGVSHATVSGWFDNTPKPPPSTAVVVALARTENLSPNWLLLGEGPEALGARVPFGDLAENLHTTIAAELKAELKTARIEARKASNREIGWVLDRLLPDADALLREIVDRYTDDSRKWIKALRSKVGRTLTGRGGL